MTAVKLTEVLLISLDCFLAKFWAAAETPEHLLTQEDDMHRVIFVRFSSPPYGLESFINNNNQQIKFCRNAWLRPFHSMRRNNVFPAPKRSTLNLKWGREERKVSGIPWSEDYTRMMDFRSLTAAMVVYLPQPWGSHFQSIPSHPGRWGERCKILVQSQKLREEVYWVRYEAVRSRIQRRLWQVRSSECFRDIHINPPPASTWGRCHSILHGKSMAPNALGSHLGHGPHIVNIQHGLQSLGWGFPRQEWMHLLLVHLTLPWGC